MIFLLRILEDCFSAKAQLTEVSQRQQDAAWTMPVLRVVARIARAGIG